MCGESFVEQGVLTIVEWEKGKRGMNGSVRECGVSNRICSQRRAQKQKSSELFFLYLSSLITSMIW